MASCLAQQNRVTPCRPGMVCTFACQLMLTRVQRFHMPGCYYRESDFCYLDDMTGVSRRPLADAITHTAPLEGEYFDLSTIPERYTGYSGPSANRVWRAIYDENCFGISEYTLSGGGSLATSHSRGAVGDNDQCLEKRVYYKIISGSSLCLCILDSYH
jgi:hypothetical protein